MSSHYFHHLTRAHRVPPAAVRTALEEAADLDEEVAFFTRVHEARSWAVFGSGPPPHRHLLRRLGLHPTVDTSIRWAEAHVRLATRGTWQGTTAWHGLQQATCSITIQLALILWSPCA